MSSISTLVCKCSTCKNEDCKQTSNVILNALRNNDKNVFKYVNYKNHIGSSFILFYNHNNELPYHMKCPFDNCFIMHVNKYHSEEGCELQNTTKKFCHFICYKCKKPIVPNKAYKNHYNLHNNYEEVSYLKQQLIDKQNTIDKMNNEIEKMKELLFSS